MQQYLFSKKVYDWRGLLDERNYLPVPGSSDIVEMSTLFFLRFLPTTINMKAFWICSWELFFLRFLPDYRGFLGLFMGAFLFATFNYYY